MKKRILATCMLLLVSLLSTAQNYNFYGTMSRDQLELYMSRAITMAGLVDQISCYSSSCTPGPSTYYDPVAFNANLSMLANMDAKYIGRSCGLWGGEWVVNGGYFNYVGQMVAGINGAYSIRQVKPVIQAAIFEIVTSDINGIMMSDEVANTYHIAKRNFRYNDMLYSNGSYVNNWGTNASVPDMSRPETQMWFYFMATQYIDRGIEALHMGQVELMDDNDPNHQYWWDLLSKIRAYAKTRNRGLVLIDAHTSGLYVGNTDQLLFDLHASPLRILSLQPHWPAPATNGGPAKLDYNTGCGTPYKNTKGGKTYFGWYATTLPYLVELDNYGISSQPNTFQACWSPWGWDEITWFGLQTEQYRNTWLKYAYYKVKCLDENAFLEMPGRRGMTEAGVPWPGNTYQAAMGYYNQANTIRDLWNGVYNNADNWTHHNFTEEEVYNQPTTPEVNSSLIFVGTDKAYYIADDGYIHGYIKDNGATGVWRTVSPAYASQVSASSQAKAKSDLIASPDGNTLLYIGIDGFIHGYTINNVWSYTYFDFPTTQMVQQNLKAYQNLVFTSNTRLYYIANETQTNNKRVHGFIKTATGWLTTSPTYANQTPSGSQQQAGGALTFNGTDRLYFVGADGFLYYHTIIDDWTYVYTAVPQTLLIQQNLRILPFKLAVNGSKVYYVGKEIANANAYHIHALIDNNNGTWATVSPSYSADFYNGQSISSQIQPNYQGEIAVSPDGKSIAYIGKDSKVYYYKDINAGWNFSYNATAGTPVLTAAAVNSLQYTSNTQLFFTSRPPVYTTSISSGDRKIHYYEFQQYFCENPAIRAVESGYVPLSSRVPLRGDIPLNTTISRTIPQRPDGNASGLSFDVFPNPANDVINLLIEGSSEYNYHYKVTNAVGQKVMEGDLSNDSDPRINTSNLPAGIYYISLMNGAHNLSGNRKIVITK